MEENSFDLRVNEYFQPRIVSTLDLGMDVSEGSILNRAGSKLVYAARAVCACTAYLSHTVRSDETQSRLNTVIAVERC
jgi:hypothetical protein